MFHSGSSVPPLIQNWRLQIKRSKVVTETNSKDVNLRFPPCSLPLPTKTSGDLQQTCKDFQQTFTQGSCIWSLTRSCHLILLVHLTRRARFLLYASLESARFLLCFTLCYASSHFILSYLWMLLQQWTFSFFIFLGIIMHTKQAFVFWNVFTLGTYDLEIYVWFCHLRSMIRS